MFCTVSVSDICVHLYLAKDMLKPHVRTIVLGKRFLDNKRIMCLMPIYEICSVIVVILRNFGCLFQNYWMW